MHFPHAGVFSTRCTMFPPIQAQTQMRLIRSVLYPAVACVLSVASVSRLEAQVDSTVKTDSTAKLTVNMEQAARGMEVFKKTCLECHTKSDVSGNDFKIKWNGRPVYELFDVIKTTMPDDKPGTLTADEYIDVVSYLVRINGAGSGGAALVAADTAGLKKAKMEIQVPSPMIDSSKVSVRQLGTHSLNSTGTRLGINHLFSRQTAIKH